MLCRANLLRGCNYKTKTNISTYFKERLERGVILYFVIDPVGGNGVVWDILHICTEVMGGVKNWSDNAMNNWMLLALNFMELLD